MFARSCFAMLLPLAICGFLLQTCTTRWTHPHLDDTTSRDSHSKSGNYLRQPSVFRQRGKGKGYHWIGSLGRGKIDTEGACLGFKCKISRLLLPLRPAPSWNLISYSSVCISQFRQHTCIHTTFARHFVNREGKRDSTSR